MQVEKKDLEKSQVELKVEISLEEFKPFVDKGVVEVSKQVEIKGFRPGKAPYEAVKQKVGEMSILEQAARLAINKTLDEAITKYAGGSGVGRPEINIVKLAPDNPFVYKVVLALVPKIELAEYKGLKIKQKKTKPKEEEIDKMVGDLCERMVKESLVDRGVQKNDKVILDIDMYLDKVPLEGGQSKGTSVIMGKEYIIAGFDKQIMGMKKGDEKNFTLPYPEKHHMKNIAGKMVEFKVKIKDVYKRKLPAMDDSLAQSFGLKTFAELKKNVGLSIQTQKDREEKDKAEKEMLDKLITKAKFGELPEILIKHEGDVMMHELEHAIVEQGGKFEDYLGSLKKTRDELSLDLLPQAVQRVKVSLLIREIANKEKIKVSSEEVDRNIKELSAQYKDDPKALKQITGPEYRDYAVNVLTSRKVVDKLREWNIVNE